MKNAFTFTASDVFQQVNLSDLFSNGLACNAVVQHVADYFADNEYSSIDSLVRDLEMAHWAACSFGLIYYSEQAEFLNIASNRDDVEEVFADLLDNMGEPIEIREMSDMLIHALDHACNAIAGLIDHAGLSVVINAVDYLDQNPEVIITDDPDGTVADIIQARLDMEVQHSTTTVSEDGLAAMEETISDLLRIEG
jgi:hydroxymethylpyrimidine pyrophosphatase-like HAD family hydrolase